MNAKNLGRQTAQFLATNAVELGAGAVTIAAGVAVYKAGEAAVATAAIVGGLVVSGALAFQLSRGAIKGLIATPAVVRSAYNAAKDRMERPEQRTAQAS